MQGGCVGEPRDGSGSGRAGVPRECHGGQGGPGQKSKGQAEWRHVAARRGVSEREGQRGSGSKEQAVSGQAGHAGRVPSLQLP